MSRLAYSASVLVLMMSLSGGALAVSQEPADEAATPAPAESKDPLRPTISPAPATPAAEQPAKPALSAEDQSVATKLQDLVENKLNQYVTRTSERAGVLAFYRDRGFAPLWVSGNATLPRANDAIAALRDVAADGLDPDDYQPPRFADMNAERLAADELQLTGAVLTYVRHASIGRVAFSRVSGSIFYDLKTPDTAEVLGKLADTKDARALLASFQPQHPAYKALKAQLAAARSGKDAAPEAKQAAKDEPPAKKSKQAKRKADEPKPQAGISKSARIDLIVANMERWRWVPRDLGPAHVLVNIPDYTLRLMNNGKQAWTTRIVVGKPGAQATPLLTETMKYITVNPTWNVPPSIIRNEYLPALARDPDALSRIGLRVGRNADGSIRIYQPPGDKNALGRIRFNFPNKFLVYQHDTPDKHLFDHTARAYSHGCMRVQNPDQYAEALLSVSQPEDNYTAQRVRGMYGNGERSIQFKKHIPVHITYQTAFVDDAGKLQTRSDVYGIDKEITSLLRDERKVADVPVSRNYHSSSKPVMGSVPQQQPSRPAYAAQPGWGWGGGYSQGDRFRTW